MSLRRRLSRLLDEGLDEMADSTSAALLQRCLVMTAVAAISLFLVPSRVCAAWLAAMATMEVWAHFGGAAVFKGRESTVGARLHHLGTVAAISGGWMTLGWLYWTNGRPEGLVAAAILWLAIVFFGQNYGHSSPTGLVVGGGVPAVAMLVAMLLSPHPAGLRIAPIFAVAALAIAFSADGATRMLMERRTFARARKRLEESEARYRMLADNSTDIIGLSRLDGERLYMSPSVEQALGWTSEEFLALSNYGHMHPDDREMVAGRMRALARRGGRETVEFRALHKDGHAVWLETCFTTAADDGGAPRIVTVARVIDARKALELELKEALQKAELAAAAKQDFLANMTHELRTPLNAIIGFSGLLEQDGSLNPAAHRRARLIGEASATLLHTVNSVLDFSRLEAGAAILDPEPFDPAEEARACATLVADQARARGLKVRVIAEGAGRLLEGDAPRIRQVLLNFLGNALKFTQQGGVELRVRRRRAGRGRAQVRFEVADTGIGVAPEQLAAVFDRFTQADVSVSRRFGGTGLGLAICKGVVELMGGRIGAESREGQGSTFWFEVDVPLARARGRSAPPAPAAELAPERPLRLLLAEDLAVNRELVQALLSPFAIAIDMAADGEEAIAAALASSYDLILMDVQMPGMDGLAAARAIRAREAGGSRTPIIAMTANVLPEQVRRCLAAGMDDHLGKPFTAQDLIEVLARWSGPRAPAQADAA